MKNKIIVLLIILIITIISGYSSSRLSNEVKNEVEDLKLSDKEKINEIGESANSDNYKDLQSLPKKYTYNMAKKNGDVVWTHKGVYNLEKLNSFINNTKKGIKDTVRVVCFTKEGDAIIKDLEYNGEVIKLIRDSTRDKFSANPSVKTYEYRNLVIENRYNNHYKGTFTEYVLKNSKEDRGTVVVQVFKK